MFTVVIPFLLCSDGEELKKSGQVIKVILAKFLIILKFYGWLFLLYLIKYLNWLRPDKIILTENHKRSLSSTLLVVENLLIDLKEVMSNANQTCCYDLKRDVDNSRIEMNLQIIEEALAYICSLKEKYSTDKSVQSLQRIIDAKKTKIWETLHNSKSRRMKGFGEFPQKFVHEYDNDIDDLMKITDQITF